MGVGGWKSSEDIMSPMLLSFYLCEKESCIYGNNGTNTLGDDNIQYFNSTQVICCQSQVWSMLVDVVGRYRVDFDLSFGVIRANALRHFLMRKIVSSFQGNDAPPTAAGRRYVR